VAASGQGLPESAFVEGQEVLSQRTSLSAIIRRIRSERDWTLAEMSDAVGIPLSTLAKVERGELSMTYDKLLQLSERLEISLLELFSMPPVPQSPVATGRRSLCDEANTITVSSRNYEDKYLCSELLEKIITPIIVEVKAASIEEFGPLITHDGEEFVYVISGSIRVYTSFYGPTQVDTGGGHYLDSQMGHAYVRAEGCNSASLLVVCASKSEGLNSALIQQMTGLAEGTPSAAPPAEKKSRGRGGSRPRDTSPTVRAQGRRARGR
jgi:transcriptional regulator with XRE-family HTH domain